MLTCVHSWFRFLRKFAGHDGEGVGGAAGVNGNTAARIFRFFRFLIALSRLSLAPFSGRVEIDECYLRGGSADFVQQGNRVAFSFRVFVHFSPAYYVLHLQFRLRAFFPFMFAVSGIGCVPGWFAPS